MEENFWESKKFITSVALFLSFGACIMLLFDSHKSADTKEKTKPSLSQAPAELSKGQASASVKKAGALELYRPNALGQASPEVLQERERERNAYLEELQKRQLGNSNDFYKREAPAIPTPAAKPKSPTSPKVSPSASTKSGYMF